MTKVPNMGMIVYVSPTIGISDNMPAVQFVAEVIGKEGAEIQTFKMKCATREEAETTRKEWQEKIEMHGKFLYIKK